jgi:hypothetical protein
MSTARGHFAPCACLQNEVLYADIMMNFSRAIEYIRSMLSYNALNIARLHTEDKHQSTNWFRHGDGPESLIAIAAELQSDLDRRRNVGASFQYGIEQPVTTPHAQWTPVVGV